MLSFALKNMGLSGTRFRVFALTLSALRLLNSRAHSKTLTKPMYFNQFTNTHSQHQVMCLHDFARFINACSKRAQGQTIKTIIKPIHLSSFSQKHLLNIKRSVYITLRFSRCMLEGCDRGRLGPPCRSHNPPRAWFLSLVCSEMPQWNANSPRDPAKSKPWRSQTHQSECN